MTTLPLAPNGIFFTIQGEGHLRGFQQTFIRIAGCSVACPECDTDYSKHEAASVEEIVARVVAITPRMKDPWAWITGGEPTDHDIRPLISALKEARFSVAVATSGHRRLIPPVDWLSVSPHRPDFLQRYGNEIKVVPGLRGLSLDDWAAACEHTDFMYRYVQPLSVNGVEQPESMAACMKFLASNPDWALSRQDHKHWGVA